MCAGRTFFAQVETIPTDSVVCLMRDECVADEEKDNKSDI